MIRIRVKATHVTIRINDGPKQRYASATHALHVIRVAVVEQGAAIEETRKTEGALVECISRARAELEAAIGDIAPVQRRSDFRLEEMQAQLRAIIEEHKQAQAAIRDMLRGGHEPPA